MGARASCPLGRERPAPAGVNHSPPLERMVDRLRVNIALAWSKLAFCGEIHNAARNRDLEKVKILLKDTADLVFSKDDDFGASRRFPPRSEEPLPVQGNRIHRRGENDFTGLLRSLSFEVRAKALQARLGNMGRFHLIDRP